MERSSFELMFSGSKLSAKVCLISAVCGQRFLGSSELFSQGHQLGSRVRGSVRQGARRSHTRKEPKMNKP